MEKVNLERLSYLTVSCSDLEKAKLFTTQLKEYIKTTVSDDILVQNTRRYLKM